MADAVLARERLLAGIERIDCEHLFEARELARTAPQLNRAVAHDGDAGRVVAAILEPSQTLDEDGENPLAADVSDDSAHVQSSVFSR
jgi:hypothetical protein